MHRTVIVDGHGADLEAVEFAREREELHEERRDVREVASAERGDGVVVGNAAAGDESKGEVVSARALDGP